MWEKKERKYNTWIVGEVSAGSEISLPTKFRFAPEDIPFVYSFNPRPREVSFLSPENSASDIV